MGNGTAIGYGGDVAPMSGAMEGRWLLSCQNEHEATRVYLDGDSIIFNAGSPYTPTGAMVKWPGLYDGV